MRVALVSDTHGVYDPALAQHFSGCALLLHAGDVGSHGGSGAILARLRALVPRVEAVIGNVDEDDPEAASLPASLLLTLAGWRVLLLHVLADAAAVEAAAPGPAPDIIVHGHSHKFAVQEAAGPGGAPQLLINPGSAGPARFKLGRSAALLTLPPKGTGWPPAAQMPAALLRAVLLCRSSCWPLMPLPAAESGERPTVQYIELAPKAPPRLAEARKQRGGRRVAPQSRSSTSAAKRLRG